MKPKMIFWIDRSLVEFGIAKGKKLWDKRKDKMDKDIKRDIDRKLKERL